MEEKEIAAKEAKLRERIKQLEQLEQDIKKREKSVKEK